MRFSHVPSTLEHKKRGCRSPRVRIKTASCYRTLGCDLLFTFAGSLPSPHAPFGRSPPYFLRLMIAHELLSVGQISYAWIFPHVTHNLRILVSYQTFPRTYVSRKNHSFGNLTFPTSLYFRKVYVPMNSDSQQICVPRLSLQMHRS